MNFYDEEMGKHLEFILLGIWIIVIIAIFLLVYHAFFEPLYEAEKRIAEERITSSGKLERR